MPQAGFFKRFGIFVRPGFLPPELCRQIIAEMLQSSSVRATVGKKGGEYVIDERIRKASFAAVAAATVEQADARFDAVRPELSSYFQVPLDRHQRLQFLHYRTGDHYAPHRDSRTDPLGAAISKARKISAVVFLNGQSEQPVDGTFAGGALTFYGLMTAPGMENAGIPLEPEDGLLVAFRSGIMHEVNPVTRGERYTLVSWFV
jgi:predicted 2-oxoglutarate/Fe(II)-dependent dioxygenase YbiX